MPDTVVGVEEPLVSEAIEHRCPLSRLGSDRQEGRPELLGTLEVLAPSSLWQTKPRRSLRVPTGHAFPPREWVHLLLAVSQSMLRCRENPDPWNT